MLSGPAGSRWVRPIMQQLYLGSNVIGDPGIPSLAAALPRAPRLVHLDLSDNRILDLGATHLAAALGRCCALRVLVLNCNQIGDQGAARMAAALAAAALEQAASGQHPRDGRPHAPAGAGECMDSAAGLDSASRHDRRGGGQMDSPGGHALALETLDVRGNRISHVCGMRLLAQVPDSCSVLLRF